MIIRKSPAEIEAMKEAGRVSAKVLREVGAQVRPGVSTLELDELAEALIRAEGRILSETHEEDGTRIRAQLPQSAMHKLKRILGGNDGSDAEKTE